MFNIIWTENEAKSITHLSLLPRTTVSSLISELTNKHSSHKPMSRCPMVSADWLHTQLHPRELSAQEGSAWHGADCLFSTFPIRPFTIFNCQPEPRSGSWTIFSSYPSSSGHLCILVLVVTALVTKFSGWPISWQITKCRIWWAIGHLTHLFI